MSAINMPSLAEAAAAQDIIVGGSPKAVAPGTSAIVNGELLLREGKPFEVYEIGLASEINPLEIALSTTPGPTLSLWRSVLIITTLAGLAFANSMSTGLITIGLPAISEDVDLAHNLLLWPSSVTSLASGCTLLIIGSVADVIGNRNINLAGCFVLGLFILASGLARTGIELVLFRAFQGIGVSMCFPTSVSILTDRFPNGRRRNIAFSCIGLSQPLGFSVGLFLGGFFEGRTLGWRYGFYFSGGATILLAIINCFNLPRNMAVRRIAWSKLAKEVDWIGGFISSACLGSLSYVFASITGDLSSIKNPVNITLLCIAIIMVPSFIFWMRHREANGDPALIPNSIWRKSAFTSICIIVLLVWAVVNSMEVVFSLYFQQVQEDSVIQTSIYFLPNIVGGVLMNLFTGLLIHRIRVDHLVLVTSVLSAVSPILMALINREWSWWFCAFPAMLLLPPSADAIFTVANLIITDVFPTNTQALAGAVFNTVSQFGTSIGITIAAIISASVTNKSVFEPKTSPDALMVGYRAVFWTCFGIMILSCGIGAVGLRKVGKVGLKRE